MLIYLVGGSLRDKILGLKIIDKDWVIFNGLKNNLIKYKFFQIGKNFPVFIHPITKDEYSLARFEKKNEIGYKGFYVNYNFFVKIEEDLYRRDLSINSIAESIYGGIVDPYYGINDIKIRALRHISLAFIEDPVRVLRVARFKSKLHNYNFFVSYETLDLMKYVVDVCELDSLSPERIWKEIIKTFEVGNLKLFFSILYKCNGLDIIKPLLNIVMFCYILKNKYNKIYILDFLYFYINIIFLIHDNFTYKIIKFFYKIMNFILLYNIFTNFYKYKIFMCLIIYDVFKFYKLSNLYYLLINNLFYYNVYIINFSLLDPRLIIKFLENLDAFRRPKICKKILLLMLINLDIFNCNFNNLLILYNILCFLNKKCFFINYNFYLYKKIKYIAYMIKINLVSNYISNL
jgi:tRNA nucleotidyltransferase (CCA-adding enzyme)